MPTRTAPRPGRGIALGSGLPGPPTGRPGTPGRPEEVPPHLLRPPCYLEVMVPARDEAQRLPHTLMRTIRYLEAQPYSAALVVVDNGSVDRTVDLVTRLRAHSGQVPIHVIGCAQQGKGAAVRRGILTSRARFIGYMDADLATPIESLDRTLPLLESGCQAVIGSRRVHGAAYAERQPRRRLLGGIVFRVLARRVLPGITDSQCGFKFFEGDLARTVARRLRVEGFAFDVELLRAIIALGAPVREIPVVWTDEEGSSLCAARDGARALRDLLRLAWHRRAGLCPPWSSSTAATSCS